MVVNEIRNLLKKPTFILNKEVLAYVKVTLNDTYEMVVLSDDSENYEIEKYIKKRL